MKVTRVLHPVSEPCSVCDTCTICRFDKNEDELCSCRCHGLLHLHDFAEATGKSWIQTYTHKKFWPLAPAVSDVFVSDIAHALSNLCRFTGHTKKFYSVAQHCEHVARYLLRKHHDARLAGAGLVHDASEAYLSDIATPVKRSGEFGTYRSAEKVLEACIEKRFNLRLSKADRAAIHHADQVMLVTEARDLMGPLLPGWGLENMPPPLKAKIVPWSPKRAEAAWLRMFKKLNLR